MARYRQFQPRLTQGHRPSFTNLVIRHHSILFWGFSTHQHQQTGVHSPPSISCLSSCHLLSLHLLTPHLHLCASSSFVCLFKFCTASPLLLTQYPQSRGEFEWKAAPEYTRWLSAYDPCSSTTSPDYLLRCGLTHITVIATTRLSSHGHPSFLSCPLRTHSHPLLLPVARLVIGSYPTLPLSIQTDPALHFLSHRQSLNSSSCQPPTTPVDMKHERTLGRAGQGRTRKSRAPAIAWTSHCTIHDTKGWSRPLHCHCRLD